MTAGKMSSRGEIEKTVAKEARRSDDRQKDCGNDNLDRRCAYDVPRPDKPRISGSALSFWTSNLEKDGALKFLRRQSIWATIKNSRERRSAGRHRRSRPLITASVSIARVSLNPLTEVQTRHQYNYSISERSRLPFRRIVLRSVSHNLRPHIPDPLHPMEKIALGRCLPVILPL